MSTCRFCGQGFTPKEAPKVNPVIEQHWLFVALAAVSESLEADVCYSKSCRSQLQYECDEFDRARKGE